MQDPISRIERVKLQGRETVTHLADVDDLIVTRDPGKDSAMTLEFVRYDAKGKPLESYRLTLCPEDAQRVTKV